MIGVYRHLARPLLFALESEQAHEATLRLLAWASRTPVAREALASTFHNAPLPVSFAGLDFPNPLGLAAGMDKRAEALPAWEALGFGFCELGGVTWHAQPGNPAPRMFRAIPDEALVNRMGFNNPGAEALGRRLRDWKAAGLWPRHPVGLNLGKSKVTPLHEAPAEYARLVQTFQDLVDFFVINVSSPNTPNLRHLQEGTALESILDAVREAQTGTPLRRPVLVKIAPDLTDAALDEIVDLALDRNVDGLVATNTTLARPDASRPDLETVYAESGGLSGRPLRRRSTEVLRRLYRTSEGKLPLIGVGGIFTAADAWEKITSGASLIQVYSGLVYQGPGLIRAIVDGLRTRLAAHGLDQIEAAVGLHAAE